MNKLLAIVSGIGLYWRCPVCKAGRSVVTPCEQRKNRTRQQAVFLRPEFLIEGREGDGYKTRKGKKSAWLVPGY